MPCSLHVTIRLWIIPTCSVVVHRHCRVLQEHAQCILPVLHIGNGFGEGAAWQQLRPLPLLVEPGKQLINHWLTVLQPDAAFLLAFQFGVSDPGFNLIQVADAVEHLLHQLRLVGLGFNKFAPAVHPAIGVGDLLVFRCIAAVRRITIADQRPGEQVLQDTLDMGSAPA